MKVYLGYYCHNDLCDVFRKVEKVFDDEVKALLWKDDVEFNKNVDTFNDEPMEWREYVEIEVE